MIIIDHESDEPVGLINLKLSPDRTGAIAYSVFPAARGRGIASRAVKLLVSWAFAELSLTCLILEADVANTASIRVAEKAGLVRISDRTMREPGQPARRLAVSELRPPDAGSSDTVRPRPAQPG